MELTKEQKKIAYNKTNGHSAIRGIAGSGKTTVGVFRIPFLLENYCFDKDDNILVVTYNKVLTNYVEELIEKHITRYNSNSLFAIDQSRVNIKTVDTIAFYHFSMYCKEYKVNYNTSTDSKSIGLLQEVVEKFKKSYSAIHQLDNFNFIKNEIDWIRHCNYSEKEYQGADRKGMTGKGDGPQKLAKDSEVRGVIYSIMDEYRKRCKEEGIIDFADIRKCALINTKDTKRKYTHILVDEAQDLSKTQLELLRNLKKDSEHATITFLYDGAQSIYNQAWLGKGRSFKSIGLDMTGKGRVLRKNYRTTTQISQAAFSLLEKQEGITGDEHFIKPELIVRNGEKPQFQLFENIDGEAKYIEELIKGKLKKYNLGDICVLGRNSNMLKLLSSKLLDLDIDNKFIEKTDKKFDDDRVKLITMHSSKGLESPVVIMVNCNEEVVPYYSSKDEGEREEEEIRERKLFYVAMTRAKELLFMSAHGKESKFIKEIDRNFLGFDDVRRINALYQVHIEDYLFQGKLTNLYGNEEKIRQWILRELIDNYRYPKELLDIEYKVKFGSKLGLADIVIYRINNGKKEPYILIEVKASGRITCMDIDQLKSYMSVCPRVEYGILCDGNKIEIIDKKGNTVEDIPCYNPMLDTDVLRKYEYKKFKVGRDCRLAFDQDEELNLELEDNGKFYSFEAEELLEVPVIGDISAGRGSLMVEDYTDFINLPKKWADNSFILKVKGDSMIGAGIDDGDLAVIKKSKIASSKDIIACSLDDECTLKQFTKADNLAILSPFNREYEPIVIDMERVEASILGILIGVLKGR